MTTDLLQGDCLEVLPTLPEASVHCCVTSPPYWGLRDYGTGADQLGLEALHDCLGWATGEACEAWELRDDLTDEEIVYVYRELKRLGIL